ncbi:MAG: hypothetical protein WD467_01345 [Candidatus Saccharimonadales bacterium]
MIFSYDKEYKSRILDSFSLAAQEGQVVDKSTGRPVPDNLGGKLTVKRFGGIRKGSLEFINKDASSLIRLRQKLKEK